MKHPFGLTKISHRIIRISLDEDCLMSQQLPDSEPDCHRNASSWTLNRNFKLDHQTVNCFKKKSLFSGCTSPEQKSICMSLYDHSYTITFTISITVPDYYFYNLKNNKWKCYF